MNTWGKNERRKKRRLVNKSINHKHSAISFILDVLIGMGIGLLVLLVVIILVIFIWDLMRGSIPLMGLIRVLEWMIN